ncbi:MAG: hypothetical protein OEY52_16550 [Gammaproteobacteria bacterium]|nr:hypothetical protein [Gammaproteobacteria bacterium]
MNNTNLIEPKFNIELEGYQFLGRGPEATGQNSGWERDDSLFFRCAECGSMMQSTTNESYSCDCGAMFVDVDYHRFGSNHGDKNIFVYRKVKT